MAPETAIIFLPFNLVPKRRNPFRVPHAKAQNKLCQFINWGQIAATVITERVLNREQKRHAGYVLLLKRRTRKSKERVYLILNEISFIFKAAWFACYPDNESVFKILNSSTIIATNN